jgi:hypothetical protein
MSGIEALKLSCLNFNPCDIGCVYGSCEKCDACEPKIEEEENEE